MKRMNYKRKIFSYFVIWSVLISSLLLYSPKNIALSASGAPEITILTPEEGSVFDVSTVEFTGRISDDATTTDKLSVKVFEQQKQNNSDQLVDISNEGKITSINKNGEFTFSKEFSEGMHTLIFSVSDENGTTNQVTRNFTILKAAPQQKNAINSAAVNVVSNRPYLWDINLIPKIDTDQKDYLPAEDMTQVPLDNKIRIVIRSAGELAYSQPLIKVASSKGEIKGTETLDKTSQQENNIKEYEFTFTPSVQFEASTTYYIYLNPSITNDTGDPIIPRFFKFTTINKNNLGDIHGNYANNTNACAYCHSAHNGKTPTLQGGQYGKASDNYCMVCHDGTNGSPMPDKYNTDNKHFRQTDGKLKDSDSCTSCHNPHIPWTKENPNRFVGLDVKDSNGTHFQPFSYKKASKAVGAADDFSLCLSCHNGTNASNIEQYYKDTTLISQSGHNIKATDDSGSPLNGQLPCAECHETHGSNNMKVLRDELGNVKLSDADKFKSQGTTWNEANERQFCLKCHNNSTQIYGKSGTLNVSITGHQQNDTQGCSTCHGGTTKSFIEAAHAPTKITP